VVAVKGVECPEDCPARAEVFSCRAEKATDVGSNLEPSAIRMFQRSEVTHHGNLKEGDKLEKMSDRNAVLVPCGHVVAKPVTNVAASADEGAAGYDQSSLVGSSCKHTITASFRHHCSVPSLS
jgi:hypothetical protein